MVVESLSQAVQLLWRICQSSLSLRKPTQIKSFWVPESWCLSKVDKLTALHKSIESYLKPFQMVAKVGMPDSTEDGQSLLLRLFLVSNVADRSRTEGLLAIKQVPQTFTPCQTCFAKREDFSYRTSSGR